MAEGGREAGEGEEEGEEEGEADRNSKRRTEARNGEDQCRAVEENHTRHTHTQTQDTQHRDERGATYL